VSIDAERKAQAQLHQLQLMSKSQTVSTDWEKDCVYVGGMGGWWEFSFAHGAVLFTPPPPPHFIVILQAILRTNLNNKIDEREKLLEVALNTLEKQSQSADVVSNIREQLSRFHIDLLLQTLYFVFVLFTSSVFQA
jgi:hypothetical protein